MTAQDLYLGTLLDSDQLVTIDADHLTTHAVCLGMTGSGKTGLGIVALEELARRHVPLLIVDLKGDMVNLLLNFPSFTPAAFEPWLPTDLVVGRERGAVAAEQAELWRSGLARADLGGDDLRAVTSGVRWQLLTPGVASAAPVDILPALSPPAGWRPEDDVDGAAERVNGVTSALLSLVGRGGDPLTDRDQVLVASIILEHWRRGEALDLARLLGSIADPPMSSLGALPLDGFYPRDERMKLVMALNTLLASPAFVAWTRGAPLTMEELLGTPTAPRASIVSVAHLDQRQRLFFLGLLISEMVAWMRRLPASSGLRALLYIDEVQGILPPHPANPPTKGPLMTLFKQGRAFGVGAWLATQNPVDLDYKALGNAGVKVIGRLITDRDRERALEGLGVRSLEDGSDIEEIVTTLDKRQFVLLDVRAKQRLRVLSSRWAMSYLRGPVTLAEMWPLLAGGDGATEAVGGAEPRRAVAGPATARDASAAAPPVLSVRVPMRFAVHGEGVARPGLMVRSRVTVERRTLGLYRRQEETWLVPSAENGLDWEAAEVLDEAPDLASEPAPGMLFPLSAPAGLDKELARAEQGFAAWRARQPVIVLANRALKLVAEAGESREDFLERCLETADRADDRSQESARKRFERRMKTLVKRLAREQDELERDQDQLAARKAEEKLGLVEGLFSVLLGSRSVRSAAGKAASRARGAAGKRRMRQQAEASVVESERELERLGRELEELADDLQDEIDRIAGESEAKAERIEEVSVRPKRADVAVLDLELVWL